MKKIVKKLENKLQAYFVKLRIDSRTVIFVRSLESLKSWLTRYPNAEKVL